MNYYNEFDQKAAQWLRELIKAGLIPAGDVDERSITEVKPHEIAGYKQCHFFAGIGGWSRALQIAGWHADEPVWTGSCPCQPFSCAGIRMGESDERHLWPVFAELIRECQPTVVFGEQVASPAGRIWLSRVRADLEGMGYAVGASDLCAAGIGAPHIRQRLYWVADSIEQRRKRFGVLLREEKTAGRPEGEAPEASRSCATGWVANANSERGRSRITGSEDAADARIASEADAPPRTRLLDGQHLQARPQRRRITASENGDKRTPWATSELICCTDGKARRVEPGTFPLAHGVSGRVGLLRGYGNAIVPQVAAEFISAYKEAVSEI